MRGLVQAVYLYANDHRDQLVSAGLGHGGSSNEHATWLNSLREDYGGNQLIARCPADQSEQWDFPILPDPTGGGRVALPEHEPQDDEEESEPLPIYRRTSYGTTYYTVARIGNRGPYTKLSMITRPSTTIFMVELAEEGAYAVYDHVHPESWRYNQRKLASEEVAVDRHLGQANYAFFDGHVSSHVFEETYSINRERSSIRKFVWNHNFYDPDIAR
jgi:prepilin-type processing-associated H-X9-DG protein